MSDERDEALPREPGVESTLMRHGGLSYLEIPAADPRRSAAFYEAVLGWEIEYRDDGAVKFSDGTGHLIGRWATDRVAAREPGLLPYFYADRIDDAVARATKHGGEVVRAPFPEGDLWVALVRDPAGNVIGIWQADSRVGMDQDRCDETARRRPPGHAETPVGARPSEEARYSIEIGRTAEIALRGLYEHELREVEDVLRELKRLGPNIPGARLLRSAPLYSCPVGERYLLIFRVEAECITVVDFLNRHLVESLTGTDVGVTPEE